MNKTQKIQMLKKGQSMLEYIMVVALALAVLVPTFYFFFSQSVESQSAIASERINSIGDNIIDQVNYVASITDGTRTTLGVSMPDNVIDIYVLNTTTGTIPRPNTGLDLVIESQAEGHIQHHIFVAYYQMFIGECDNNTQVFSSNFLNTGSKSIKIESCGNYVAISES